jgi:heterotetrameric sarcosine oxidase gamma subunit
VASVAPRSALVALMEPAANARASAAAVNLYEHCGSPIVHLEGPREGHALAAIRKELGLTDLAKTGGSDCTDGSRLLSIGPSIWLFVGEPPGQLDEAFDLALDMSHAWTRLVVTGPRSTELLAKGCALDLHRAMFSPGSCAVTGFARMRTIIWRSLDERFDLLIGRSYAASLWAWLEEAAEEFGFTR